MAQYIDKDALIAEINTLLDDEFRCNSYDEATGFQNALTLIKKFIDTLEVKDVDLDTEYAIDMTYLQNWYQDSIDSTKEPIWTDKHLKELFNDFYLIPKKKGE